MRIEKQVCSLKLAERLKELGVKQESLYVWLVTAKLDGSCRTETVFSKERAKNLCITADRGSTSYDAFSVAELGEMLPTDIGGFESIIQGRWQLQHVIEYRMECNVFGGIRFGDVNEANARAKVIIYLLENKLVTL